MRFPDELKTRHSVRVTWLEESDWETGEVRVAVFRQLPFFLLARLLRRRCRRYERQGFEVIETFRGRANELFQSGKIRSLDTGKPNERATGAVLRPQREADPALLELRAADAEYHRLCIELQEPYVPVSDLPLEELEQAVDRLVAAIKRLRTQRPGSA